MLTAIFYAWNKLGSALSVIFKNIYILHKKIKVEHVQSGASGMVSSQIHNSALPHAVFVSYPHLSCYFSCITLVAVL